MDVRRLVCSGLWLALIPTTVAGQPATAPGGQPTWGCGKAHAMVAALDAHADTYGATTEAMGDTDVLSYALNIEISNLNTTGNNCFIAGTNVMTIRSLSPALTQFTFRLRSQYAISSALVNGATPVTVTTSGTTTRVATLDRPYTTDEVFTLAITYSGTSSSAGFGSITVGTQGGTPVVATLSEAYYAYTWWPCKDGDVGVPGDNSDKALMDFTITVPNNFTVPSNGLLVSTEQLSGNRRRHRWVSNYPISTYLVSFAATNYNKWTQTYTYPGGTMPVEFYIYPGSDTPTNRTNWEKCLNMLNVYRPIFGEYPFVNEKYGIYQFNFGGGMEHQTMTGQGTFNESVTAHELGHQWWGDMVTCRTWSDIWLNEGFATYTECLWEERKTGTPNTTAYFNAVNARRPSSNGANDSVYVYPAAIASGGMNRIFSQTYSYFKGCWVLHQLRHVVGDATFFDILAAYRAAHQYGAATTDDFAAVASATSGQDLTAFFDQWVYQKGAPAYQYGWQSVNVNGQNYLLARIAQTQTPTTGSPPQVPGVFVMPIDLRVTIGGNQQTLVVKNDARTEWFVVPVSGTVTALSFDPGPWILRSSATSQTYAPGPPRIVSTTPAPGATPDQTANINRVTIWFHTPVNAADANFSLVGSTTGAQSFTLASGSNVNPAVLNLAAPLPADTYTLTVTSGVTAVNSGMQLDGEIADPANPASLPSGDGVAGGTATIQFAVTPCDVAADIDGDCDHDPNDVAVFTSVLLGDDIDPLHVSRSDLNNDNSADGLDVGPFVTAFLDG